MFLFLVCSLIGGMCQRPVILPAVSQLAAIGAVPVVPPVDTGPFWGNGQPWTGITDKDTGFCPGYGMPSGNGGRPSLSWPVPGGTAHEGRGFRIGHTGLDIDAAEGTAVQAAAAGTVVWAGWSTWGFGYMVAISHGGGWFTMYGHLSAVSVGCGQWVGGGYRVGLVGDTGSVTKGYFHLHFELRNGAYSYAPL